MENASKALLMAAGILVGILILSLMVTLFASSSSLSKSYDETKHEEAIQQFNSNFTKYLEKDITIHDVVTLCNFADKYGVEVSSGLMDVDDIKDDVAAYSYDEGTGTVSIITYKIEILSYSDTGYIDKIKFTEN